MQMQIFTDTNKGIRFKNNIKRYYNKYFILDIVYVPRIVTRLNFSRMHEHSRSTDEATFVRPQLDQSTYLLNVLIYNLVVSLSPGTQVRN